MQFLETADRIEKRAMEVCRKWPKTYAFARKIERAYSLFPLCGIKEGRGPKEEQEKSGRILEEFMNLCLEEEDALKGNLHYVRTMELHRPKTSKKPSDTIG